MRAAILLACIVAGAFAGCFLPDPGTVFNNIKKAEDNLQAIAIENGEVWRLLEAKETENSIARDNILELAAQVSFTRYNNIRF
jgi:hypothetical protein